MSAIEAMDASQLHDRIVHLRWSEALAGDLFAACDAEAVAGDVHEYWGPSIEDDDDDEGPIKPWRVHLHGAPTE